MISRIVIFIGLLCFLRSGVYAQKIPPLQKRKALVYGTITGSLVDSLVGKAPPCCQLHFVTDSSGYTRTCTGDDGHFSFKTDPAENYTVRLSCDGYKEAVFNNVQVGSGETRHLEISLKRIPGIEPRWLQPRLMDPDPRTKNITTFKRGSIDKVHH